MIFRIYSNKLYPMANVYNEDEFLRKQQQGKVEFRKIQHSELPTIGNWSHQIFYEIADGNYVVDYHRTNNNAKQKRYEQLQKTFKKKWLGIQALIIDKAYMTDARTIQSQIESYEKLGQEATKKLADNPDNEVLQGIVAKYNQSLAMQFEVNFLMQQIRGVLEYKIENNTDDIDELLNLAENIKLSKNDLTADKLNEMKEMFRL